jgi:peptide deformylase
LGLHRKSSYEPVTLHGVSVSILKVAQMGHPVLRQIAEPVPKNQITSPEFQSFLFDMLETMEEYDGAGLAAPQVHQPIRVVCLTLTQERGPEFWINPELTPLGEHTQSGYEGCLSVAGLRARVSRFSEIRVTFLDPRGERQTLELGGFPAVVAQHECDHLDGVLYVDKAEAKTLTFLSEYQRYGGPEHYDESVEADPGNPVEDRVVPL